MEYTLQPVMTRLDPVRDIEPAKRYAFMYDGKLAPVVRLFFRIGLSAYEKKLVPHDPKKLHSWLEQDGGK